MSAKRDIRSGPVRTCLGCRRRDAQAVLVRLAADGDRLIVDVARKQPGRGAWVHPDPRCVSRVAVGALERGLRKKLTPTATADLFDRVARHPLSTRYPSEPSSAGSTRRGNG